MVPSSNSRQSTSSKASTLNFERLKQCLTLLCSWIAETTILESLRKETGFDTDLNHDGKCRRLTSSLVVRGLWKSVFILNHTHWFLSLLYAYFLLTLNHCRSRSRIIIICCICGISFQTCLEIFCRTYLHIFAFCKENNRVIVYHFFLVRSNLVHLICN